MTTTTTDTNSLMMYVAGSFLRDPHAGKELIGAPVDDAAALRVARHARRERTATLDRCCGSLLFHAPNMGAFQLSR